MGRTHVFILGRRGGKTQALAMANDSARLVEIRDGVRDIITTERGQAFSPATDWQAEYDRLLRAISRVSDSGLPPTALSSGTTMNEPKARYATAVDTVLSYHIQPANDEAWAIGGACNAASNARGGDLIDLGLSLLCELEARCFGIARLPVETRSDG